jgi:hypothetical protein
VGDPAVSVDAAYDGELSSDWASFYGSSGPERFLEGLDGKWISAFIVRMSAAHLELAQLSEGNSRP